MEIGRFEKSENPNKKYDIVLLDKKERKEHKISFGAKGYDDFTTYSKRGKVLAELHKERYLARHKAREDWTKDGILTPGFWSRWILWNLPTVEASLQDVRRRFQV